jgi:hypothetical protein
MKAIRRDAFVVVSLGLLVSKYPSSLALIAALARADFLTQNRAFRELLSIIL